jgi:hypothetical protein
MGFLLPDGRCGRRHGAACTITGAGWPPPGGPVLTNRIALWLALIILAGILADATLNGGAALFFLARKFLDMIEWVAFWR